MAEKEIKIKFPEGKLEALQFFLKQKEMEIEGILSEHLEKTYQKVVPAPVKEFTESRNRAVEEPEAEPGRNNNSGGNGRRQGRGQGRNRENTAVSNVPEQEETPVEEEQQEESQGMSMVM